MRIPIIFYADDVKKWCHTAERESDGRWVLARPYALGGLFIIHRIKMAWGVFTGNYDVLIWKAGQTKGYN